MLNSELAQQPGLMKPHDREGMITGFTAGGPVDIPQIYNGRDKTFFLSYEQNRQKVTNSVNEN